MASPFNILRCTLFGHHYLNAVLLHYWLTSSPSYCWNREYFIIICYCTSFFPKYSSKRFTDLICFVSIIYEVIILENSISMPWCKALCIPGGFKITLALSWWPWVFSLGLVSCFFLPSNRGFLHLLAFLFTFHSSPRQGRCFHWHNFDTNSRIEEFSQISCKLLFKCSEYSGSVFCLCSFCHVAWLITMFSLMKQSLLTCIWCWFAFYVWSPISFFTVTANFFFLFYAKVWSYFGCQAPDGN